MFTDTEEARESRKLLCSNGSLARQPWSNCMPRLITRLLRHLENSPLINKTKRTTIVPIRPPRKTSLLRPRLPVPSLSAANRTQSILVDDVNPIVNADAYTRHKSLPPTLWPRRRAIRTRGEFDRPRSMTDEERGWWASPYRACCIFLCITE